jgi:tRNA pseudouridine55 synthase
MHGFLCIDKPLGVTSHDVVAQIRRLSRVKRVGHAGTLDPAASGVLVVALVLATRLIEYVQDDTYKRYDAGMTFGVATDSDDAMGNPIRTAQIPALTAGDMARIETTFCGDIMQVPPQVSALHVNGERMYDLVRRGEAPVIPARPVHVYDFAVTAWQAPHLLFTVTCGKGTYIRAIARDIGELCASAGHLHALRRTQVGTFTVANSVTLAQLQSDGVTQHLQPTQAAVADWVQVTVNDSDNVRIQRGMPIAATSDTHTRAIAVSSTGQLVAVLAYQSAQWHPRKVFQWGEV